MNPVYLESVLPVFILLSVVAAIMFVSKEAKLIRRDSEVEKGSLETSETENMVPKQSTN